MRNSHAGESSLLEDVLAFGTNLVSQILESHDTKASAKERDPRERSKKDVLRDLFLQKMDLVTREEHDVVLDLLAKSRLIEADLETRIHTIELALKKTNQSVSPRIKKTSPSTGQKKTKPNQQKKSGNLPSVNQAKKQPKPSRESRR